MPTHKEIYASHATQYEALISCEDYQGNILAAIQKIVPPENLDVIDLGAGTGRLARLLAPRVRRMLAFDLSPHMLRVGREKLRSGRNKSRWLAAAADHRCLPLAGSSTDLIVGGWSVSYVATWHPDSWRSELDAWLSEARRVLRPNGRIILFESLGTGNEAPQRLPHLENFYDWVERAGFAAGWIRTDYRFQSLAAAEQLAGFFFGEQMLPSIRRAPEITLPECTGVWWMQVGQGAPAGGGRAA